ncbi:MAG: DUF4258 domain-containing protein [Peptostreptococcaceae bacterium]|jgi:hypothetical protein|nr:DUF4258 domain-containing protein [Peptostreptococcaceae bacterium]
MKKNFLSFLLMLTLCLFNTVAVFADYSNADYNNTGKYEFVFIEENEELSNGRKSRLIWDLADVAMFGWSLADLVKEPSWGNFGWVVLDAAALIPGLPSGSYTRRGGKLVLNEAGEKFLKSSEGKKLIANSIKATKVAKVGDKIKDLGKLVKHPGITVDWSKVTKHGLERMSERNVTKSMVETFVKNGKAIKQSSSKYLFLTKEGAAVLSKEGKLITTYTKNEFKDHVKKAIKVLYGN